MEPFVEKYFKRFDKSQRIQHLVLFLAFLGLGLTGIPQLFAYNFVAQGWLDLLGGGENARTIHHICGAVMIVLSLYHLMEMVARALMGKGSLAMIPTPHDGKTVYQNIMYYIGVRKDPPEFGRYDYMEKMEYLALMWGNFIMALTGLMLWFPLITVKLLPGQAIPVAGTVHAWEAILAGAYVLIVHMYFAHFKPESFPYDPMMTDGRITEHHFKEHHPREYEKVTGQSASHEAHEGAWVESAPEPVAPTGVKEAPPKNDSKAEPADDKSSEADEARRTADESRRQALQ